MQVGGVSQCALPTCNRDEFLPFECDMCQKVYCLDHRTYAAHSCPKAAGKDCRVIICPLCKNSVRVVPEEDVNATFDRHRRSPDCAKKEKKRCPAKGCKETLGIANTFKCDRCGQDVCLKHRYEDDHPCTPPQKAAPKQPPGAAAPQPPRTAPQPPQAPKPKPKKKGLFACLCGGNPKVQED